VRKNVKNVWKLWNFPIVFRFILVNFFFILCLGYYLASTTPPMKFLLFFSCNISVQLKKTKLYVFCDFFLKNWWKRKYFQEKYDPHKGSHFSWRPFLFSSTTRKKNMISLELTFIKFLLYKRKDRQTEGDLPQPPSSLVKKWFKFRNLSPFRFNHTKLF